MKVFIPLAVLGIIAAGFGTYALKVNMEVSAPGAPLVLTRPTPVITPVQTNESLDAILRGIDSTASTEHSVAATADIQSADQTLVAEDQTLRALNTSTSTTYAK